MAMDNPYSKQTSLLKKRCTTTSYYNLTAAADARHGGVVEHVLEPRLAAALVTDAGALLALTTLAAVDDDAGCMHGHGDETRLAHKRMTGRGLDDKPEN